MSADPEFEKIVNLYYRDLYRFGLSLTCSEADACDLTQETFYIWANKGHQLQKAASLYVRLECSGHAEPGAVVPARRFVPEADGRTNERRYIAIGAAAHNASAAIAVLPRTAVRRCTLIVVVPTIFSPLPDIAKHVVETELVWRETANRRCECIAVAALSIHAALARMLLTEVQITMIDVAAEFRRTIATVTRRRRSTARRVFPLSLRW